VWPTFASVGFNQLNCVVKIIYKYDFVGKKAREERAKNCSCVRDSFDYGNRCRTN